MFLLSRSLSGWRFGNSGLLMGGVPKKIQCEDEIARWFNDGKTFSWMQQRYREKYGIETTQTLFQQFCRRRGYPRRTARNIYLIPWKIDQKHWKDYTLRMLRCEAKEREGFKLGHQESVRLRCWRERMMASPGVIDYTPERGFVIVPRRPGVDLDLIRVPGSNHPNLRKIKQH